ncbi:MAG TPA: UDP-glucose/GDP-mannose dehydrogenase family protein [bacterium]|nr:UDP-glucose/GDP-mannose dehydrogenase family protein [bacterium]HEX68484.1 UDP-glucose/GDP-mannose dehydrogenase family protein [bacterium]
MKLSVIGVGHVGLVTAACFARKGHKVVGVDADEKKITLLQKGKTPFYEPGLEELVQSGLKEKKLVFTTSIREGVKEGEVIFICVGTPPLESGEADLSYVEKVAREIGKWLNEYRLIVEKSTVPVETGEWIERTIRLTAPEGVDFDVGSNPEFLREGQAVKDFMEPDRIVIGVENERAKKILEELYRDFEAPKIFTNIRTAELIKHASNAFLATKISFINAVAEVCERVGADVRMVAKAMGMDPRIGPHFLQAGAGFGGACFPKDLDAFLKLAENKGYDFKLLKVVKEINDTQRKKILKKIKEEVWILKEKRVAILGLSFKPGTDDIRNSPAEDLILALLKEGAQVRAYDPVAIPPMREKFPQVFYAQDPYQASEGAEAVVILTEWEEFKNLDLGRLKKLMNRGVIVDGRNLLEPEKVRAYGFIYRGVGVG